MFLNEVRIELCALPWLQSIQQLAWQHNVFNQPVERGIYSAAAADVVARCGINSALRWQSRVVLLESARGELIAKPDHRSFTRRVQLEFNLKAAKRNGESLALRQCEIPILLVRNPRAKRYLLRLQPDGSARVTVPRGGSMAEARRFAERNAGWLERMLLRQSTRPNRTSEWLPGTEILFRGEPVRLEAWVHGEGDLIRFGNEVLKISDPRANLRPVIERHLWKLAARELPPRVLEFAALHQLPVRRVSVRNQRSRWGSCSQRGTICLNWRIIQAPPFVRDYLILHELMHLRQMNHSARFWREVQRVCPDYKAAERWLKQHADLIR